MSAALWAETTEPTEPYDPHSRLGSVHVAGTDTGPPQAPRGRVRLVVWGTTDRDRRAAEQDARTDRRVARYRIVDVVQSDSAAAASDDLVAIARRAVYDRTWAVYRLPDDDGAGPARV